MEAKVIKRKKKIGVLCDPADGFTAMLVLEWLSNQTCVEKGFKAEMTADDTGTYIRLFGRSWVQGEHANAIRLADLAAYINANKGA